MSANTFRFHADWDFLGTTSAATFVPSSPATAPEAPGQSAAARFARTDRGDAELHRPVLALPTHARELLFVVDRGIPIERCLAAVRGAQFADVMQLLGLGLIRNASSGPAACGQAEHQALQGVVDALLALPFHDLYSLLTQQAKRRLGLLQGFRMVLALERCEDAHEQRALAVRFVQEVWRTHGERGIEPLRRLLLRTSA